MGVVDERLRQLLELDARLKKERPALPGDGGGGTSSGVEERVIRLEGDVGRLKTDVAELRKDVGDLKVGLATLTERVAHLPSKAFIVTAVTSLGALISALTLFADKVRGLLH